MKFPSRGLIIGWIEIPVDTAWSKSLRFGVSPPTLLFWQNSILAGLRDATLTISLILKLQTSKFRDNLILIEFCVEDF